MAIFEGTSLALVKREQKCSKMSKLIFEHFLCLKNDVIFETLFVSFLRGWQSLRSPARAGSLGSSGSRAARADPATVGAPEGAGSSLGQF